MDNLSSNTRENEHQSEKTLLEEKMLLEHALEEAHKEDKERTEFLNNMSHDIRTPMNAIIGYASLAISHIDDKDKTEEYLSKILTAGNQMLDIVNAVLDLSNIDSGKVQIEEKPVSLTELIKDVDDLVQDELNEKGISYEVDISGVTNRKVYCDKMRVNQVLLNVLVNAIKFTDVGGKINLKMEEIESVVDGSAAYEIRIRDNGIGMSEDFVKRIFVPFEKEKNNSMRQNQGTGLGMAITKKLVDMMGGTIRVDSRVGEGTEVTLRLPLRVAEEFVDTQHNEVTSAEALKFGKRVYLNDFRQKVYGKKLLLVEDNELNQEIEYEILREAGFEVDVADDGITAVEIMKDAAEDEYDLILMDIQMPIMNGYEATMRIRRFKNKKKAGIPIIAMTANAFAEDRQTALRVGMNGHISKPISISRLMNMLGEFLQVS
jgi:CheY-like chemotaxis protein/nitrogen-specific signal transduction histidine kinase